MRPEPDVVLGDRYVLIRRIAVGGMGEVWEATDRLLNRVVAVKILKEEFRTASTFLARFRAEARHAGQLNHHGIATVFDYGESSDLAYLVMELVRGKPLSDLLIEQPAMQTATKLSILSQAADALQAAHQAGVVHRDVKPGNLMVGDDGNVKVTDFGIARALTSASLTDQGQMLGTPAYVSPEQATGDLVTGASDIYSLGVVAYEMFAGRPPFERDSSVALAMAHVNEPPPPLPDTVPWLVAELIKSALAKDPSQRPPSAAHFADQLRRHMETMKPPSPTAPQHQQDRAPTPTTVMPAAAAPIADRPPTRSMPVVRSHNMQGRSYVMLAALVGLLVVMGTAIWVATRPDPTDAAQSDLSVATLPVATQPSTASPLTTQPATTQPATTQPSTTQVTQPTATQPSPPTTQPPTTPPVQVQPTSTPSPPSTTSSAAAEQAGPIGDAEAVTFVIDYYELLAAGDYEITWESLSPEFRDDRNLTYDSYVSYWENTTLELDDVTARPGPGADESRVRFDARYTTRSGVIEETDEITLRRLSDGQIIITEQRVV